MIPHFPPKVAPFDETFPRNFSEGVSLYPFDLKEALATKMLNVLDDFEGLPIADCLIPCGSVDLLPSNQKLALVEQRLTIASKPSLLSLDRQYNEQFCLAVHHEDIALVPINRLRAYAKHPFKAYSEEKMNALMESIARDGLQHPIVVRKVSGVIGWEILSGHNRVEAMRRLGRIDIPSIIRDLDDDKAALVVVESNLEQRDKLLPSEKAFAYKLQMEALQGQSAVIQNDGLSSDGNGLGEGGQIVHHRKRRDILAESQDETGRNIQRYIRLTALLPKWLDKLDSGEVPVMVGYELSFLDADAQQETYRYFFQTDTKVKLTVKHAEAIRAAYQSSTQITAENISTILHKPKKKPGPVTYRYSLKDLKKQYPLPDGFDLTSFVHEKLKEAFKTA